MDLTKRYEAYKDWLRRETTGYVVECMKFQCRGAIGIGILDTVHDLDKLLRLLEERDEINASNLFYLEMVFRYISRNDLLKVTQEYNDTRESGTFTVPDTGETFTSGQLPNKKGQLASDSIRDDEAMEETSMKVEKSYVESSNEAGPFTTTTCTANTSRPPSDELARGIEIVVNTLSRGWQNAARHLGIPESIIDNAVNNWPRNVRNQIKETFAYWERNGADVSLPCLIECMRYVRRNDIADELEYGGL